MPETTNASGNSEVGTRTSPFIMFPREGELQEGKTVTLRYSHLKILRERVPISFLFIPNTLFCYRTSVPIIVPSLLALPFCFVIMSSSTVCRGGEGVGEGGDRDQESPLPPYPETRRSRRRCGGSHTGG